MRKRVALLIATVLSLVAVSLVAAPVAAETKDPPRYYAVLLAGQKLGYMVETRDVAGGEVASTVEMSMTMQRGPVAITVTQKTTNVETPDGKPLRFESLQNISGMTTRIEGTVAEGQMTVKRITGGRETTSTQPWPKDALMTEGISLLTHRMGLKEGTKYDYLEFSPETLDAHKSEVAIGAKETFTILGESHEGIRVNCVVHVPSGQMPLSMHVDDEANLLRMDLNMGFMKLEVFKCDEAFARSPAKTTVDFLDDFLLAAPAAIPADARKVVFTLKKKHEKDFTLPETDSQHVCRNDDGTTTVTVTMPDLPKGQSLPYAGDDAAALEALKPSPFVQSDDPKIVEKARAVVGKTDDAAEAAVKLTDWVRRNLRKKNLSIGYASASEVMRDLAGDCTEHSVLLAALCRAAGIPARTAMGMLYVPQVGERRNVLGGHQWTQVFLGGKWYDLDATLPAPHRTVGRITEGTGLGSEHDWWQFFNSLGLFEVTEIRTSE